MFRQEIRNGHQFEQPDNWLIHPDPWEVARKSETVEVSLSSSARLQDGKFHSVPGQLTHLLGVPYDRPVVGYGGKTINTLRLWAASSPDLFDFGEFSQGEFFSAVLEKIAAESLTKVLYPDDSTARAARSGSCRSISWSRARWPISCAGSGIAATSGPTCPGRWPFSSTIPTRPWPSPSCCAFSSTRPISTGTRPGN